MKFYLDLIVGRTPAGMKVVGSPQIWEVGTNWKFAADNFTGDNQHLSSAHGSMVELGMLPPDPMAMSYGHLIDAGGGHVLHMVPGPPAPDGHYFGLPPAQREGLAQALSDPQLEALRDHIISVGTVFPNFSFMQVQIQGHIDGPPVPFLSWRLWVPTSATTTRVYSWFFIDADADDDYLRDSLACYVHTFGPSGVYEQDDMMNWEECTRVNAGVVARRYDMHHGMNVHLEPSPTWPGPGLAYPSSYGEMTQLAFYRELRQYLTEGAEHRSTGTAR